jgi:hypothetical protein
MSFSHHRPKYEGWTQKTPSGGARKINSRMVLLSGDEQLKWNLHHLVAFEQ